MTLDLRVGNLSDSKQFTKFTQVSVVTFLHSYSDITRIKIDFFFQLHSRETWLKEARQIKMGQEPYKLVKRRPNMKDIKHGIKITEPTLPVYGRWQTETFVPPTAKDVSDRIEVGWLS